MSGETVNDPCLCRCGKPGSRNYHQNGDNRQFPTHWRCSECFHEDQAQACAALGFTRRTDYRTRPKVVCDGCGSESVISGWPGVDLCAKCDRIFDSVINEGLRQCPPCLDDQAKYGGSTAEAEA